VATEEAGPPASDPGTSGDAGTGDGDGAAAGDSAGVAGAYSGTVFVGPRQHQPEATIPVPMTLEVRFDGSFIAKATGSGTPPALYSEEFVTDQYRYDAKWEGVVSADGAVKGTGTEELDTHHFGKGNTGWFDSPPKPSTIVGEITGGRFTGSSNEGLRIEASKSD
jgi:hypothetical protein